MLVVAPFFTWQLLDPEVGDSECLELLNVLDDELVRETHRRFRMVGAQCTPTNTLRANRVALEVFGLEDALEDINRMGVQLAREAGFEHVLATIELGAEAGEEASVSPFCDRLAALSEQAGILLSENPDALWLVGEVSRSELLAAVTSLRALTDLPIIAPAEPLLDDAVGADILCIMGKTLDESLREVRETSKRFSLPLMVCPNTGKAERSVAKLSKIEQSSLTDKLLDYALHARSLGVQFVGTAPGSSPEFSGAISAALSGLDAIPPVFLRNSV
jgi:homocysteine S-methyltransferase